LADSALTDPTRPIESISACQISAAPSATIATSHSLHFIRSARLQRSRLGVQTGKVGAGGFHRRMKKATRYSGAGRGPPWAVWPFITC
jgi:hypothetical protein